MQTRKLMALFLVTAGWIPALGQAAQEPFGCPLELPRTEQTLKTVPPGFTAMTAVPLPVHELTGFRVNDGPPSHQDPTKYDSITTTQDPKGQTTETLTWTLAGIEDPYVVCLYRSTSQVLFRSATGYQQCVVESKGRVNTVLKIVNAVCR